MAGDPVEKKKASGRRLRLGLAWVAAAALCCAAIATGIWRLHPQSQVPFVDVASAEPAIARAVEEARAGVMASPRSARAWGRLGAVLLVHDLDIRGISCFQEAERLDPRNPRWPYLQGIWLEQEQPEAALPKFRRAAEICPTVPAAPRLRLAMLLLKRGDLDEAGNIFRRILGDDPANAQARLGLGEVALARGVLAESISELKAAAEDPAVARSATRLLATIEERSGDAKSAASDAAAAASLPPDAPITDPFLEEAQQLRVGKLAAFEHVNSLVAAGDLESAVELMKQTARDYVNSHDAWAKLAEVQLKQGDSAGAEQAMRQALQLMPDKADYLTQLSVTLLRQHRNSEAKWYLQEAVRQTPNFALAHYHLALCALDKDNVAAEKELRRTIELQPELVEAYDVLGRVLNSEGHHDQAIQQWRKALALKPGDERARRYLSAAPIIQTQPSR